MSNDKNILEFPQDNVKCAVCGDIENDGRTLLKRIQECL